MDFNPVLLQNLLEEDLRDDDSFVASYQKENLLKKWEQSSSNADSAAISLFREMNDRASTLQFEDTPLVAECLDFLRDKSFRILQSKDGHLQRNSLDLRDCLDHGAVGPGSSVGTKYSDFFRKMFAGHLSVTSIELYKLYKYTVSNNWRSAEETRSQRFKVDVVEGSNLSTVPKNAEISRTICTEPGLNMFYQLGAGRIIEGHLKRVYNIDLAKQPDINRFLAQQGSMTGSFATIDLKSASDTISLNLCRTILPPEVFEALSKIRSQSTKIEGEYVDLHIMCSMGNGFCFPLQTLIFAMVCEFAYSKLGIKQRPHVFGDDIVCLRQAYDLICQLLEGLGFIVNIKKSFNDGSFRESCGHDYHLGVNVRSVYLRKIENDQDLYSAFNRLCRWSCLHRKPLYRTLNCLFRLVQRKLFVPFHESDTGGFKCPEYYSGSRKTRYGSRFYFTTEPIPRRFRLTHNVATTYYHGALTSVLGGYVTRNALTLRSIGGTVYKTVRKVTPCWDFQPDSRFRSSDFEAIWHALLVES
jgi:hypothetical protein